MDYVEIYIHVYHKLQLQHLLWGDEDSREDYASKDINKNCAYLTTKLKHRKRKDKLRNV